MTKARLTKAYDVAIVGAGVFGAWTALALQRSGRSVALLDAYGPGNSRSSSGGESRIIRMGYGADEIYTRMAARSLHLWLDFFHHARQPLLFHRTGVLWTATAESAHLTGTGQALKGCGVRFENLSQTDLAQRYPQFHFEEGRVGIFEPQSGAIMARRAVQAVVHEAVREGAEYFRELVEAPAGSGRLEAIRTRSERQIRAGSFVFACGAWLPGVFPELLEGRIRPTRQDVFFFGTGPGDRRFGSPGMPIWIDFSDPRGGYAFPDLENRGVKLAFDRHGPPIVPDSEPRVISPESIAAARAFLALRFPALADAPLIETRVCQYENTSNGDFLIDQHPDFDNVWLAGGGSGHGFKHGPAIGEYLTRVLFLGAAAEPRFSLESKAREAKRAVY